MDAKDERHHSRNGAHRCRTTPDRKPGTEPVPQVNQGRKQSTLVGYVFTSSRCSWLFQDKQWIDNKNVPS
jgi:hypothetical protein